MSKLLDFILKEIAGKDKFEIKETKDQDLVQLEILAKPEVLGLIIGKGGKTIRAIRNILKVRATLDKVGVRVFVTEKN